MEATILIKWDSPRELDKLLHSMKMDISRGVIEFDDKKNIKFRLLEQDELPIFNEDEAT